MHPVVSRFQMLSDGQWALIEDLLPAGRWWLWSVTDTANAGQ